MGVVVYSRSGQDARGSLAAAVPGACCTWHPAPRSATAPAKRTRTYAHGSHTTLYTIEGAASPDGPRINIGTLCALSRFFASRCADDKLFFRHQE